MGGGEEPDNLGYYETKTAAPPEEIPGSSDGGFPRGTDIHKLRKICSASGKRKKEKEILSDADIEKLEADGSEAAK